ncbi:STAS domain-containing protein [Dactylosporangium sp. NPDC050588]|uniref:STAS domain-containing protein n=1 Tax=Dactylosporangium sp. NPDC050588 TaxID=3157211 RepID=UPI0033EBAF0F
MSQPHQPQLTLTEHTGLNGVVTVSAAGEIDMSTAGRLTAVLTRVLTGTRPSRLVVDLAGVRFMDSTGIGALVQARRLATTTGTALRVTNPSPIVTKVLQITGLFDALTADD